MLWEYIVWGKKKRKFGQVHCHFKPKGIFLRNFGGMDQVKKDLQPSNKFICPNCEVYYKITKTDEIIAEGRLFLLLMGGLKV